MKKFVEYQRVWQCENMDSDAPITREGYIVLFDDGSKKVFWDDVNYNIEYEEASEEEKKNTYMSLGYLFKGQQVEIIGGRTIGQGEKKTIKDFYTFSPRGTFGHCCVDYVIFTDGTKIATKHIKPTCKLLENINYFTQFVGHALYGGRL